MKHFLLLSVLICLFSCSNQNNNASNLPDYGAEFIEIIKSKGVTAYSVDVSEKTKQVTFIKDDRTYTSVFPIKDSLKRFLMIKRYYVEDNDVVNLSALTNFINSELYFAKVYVDFNDETNGKIALVVCIESCINSMHEINKYFDSNLKSLISGCDLLIETYNEKIEEFNKSKK